MTRLDPLEIGWQFVQEYYTILNREPQRLHCFYDKGASCMLHGTEGESVSACLGQHAIHARIRHLDLADAKVVISNVDCQSSLSGSILVCVLGEMETRRVPSRKFAQTFLLAEQPNGYFVLNDVFRYLKEDMDLSAASLAAADEGATMAAVADEQEQLMAALSLSAEPTSPQHASHDSISHPAAEPLVPEPAVAEPLVAEPLVPEPAIAEPAVVVSEPAVVVGEPAVSENKKTWATLAVKGKERWAKQATPEIHVQAVSVPAPSEPIPPTLHHTPTPSQPTPAPPKEKSKKQQHHQQRFQDFAVFIRGFTKSTRVQQIREAFAKQVAPLRWIDLVSDSAAFIEFDNMDHVKAALELQKMVINGETIEIHDKTVADRRFSLRSTTHRRGAASLANKSAHAHQ